MCTNYASTLAWEALDAVELRQLSIRLLVLEETLLSQQSSIGQLSEKVKAMETGAPNLSLPQPSETLATSHGDIRDFQGQLQTEISQLGTMFSDLREQTLAKLGQLETVYSDVNRLDLKYAELEGVVRPVKRQLQLEQELPSSPSNASNISNGKFKTARVYHFTTHKMFRSMAILHANCKWQFVVDGVVEKEMAHSSAVFSGKKHSAELEIAMGSVEAPLKVEIQMEWKPMDFQWLYDCTINNMVVQPVFSSAGEPPAPMVEVVDTNA